VNGLFRRLEGRHHVERQKPGWAEAHFEPLQSKTPSTNPQAPEKLQILKHQTPNTDAGQTARRPVFELGAWCFFGAWSLEFGAWRLVSQLLKN
jgi:hypothetical protein